MSLKSIINRFTRVSLLIAFIMVSVTTTFAQDPDPAIMSKGEELFKGNCSSCHDVHKDKVGPALTGVAKRRDLKWIKKFVRGPMKVITVEKDPYAVALFEKYGKAEMQAFPTFADEEIEAIITYVMNAPEPVKEVKVENGGGTAAAAGDDNSTLILTLTVVTLGLVLITLVVLISVIRRYLKDKEDKLDEDDKEIVNQGFSISAVITHKAFIIIVSLIFVGVATRACWVNTMSIGVEQNYRPIQPIPFSHKLHAGDMKIDCGYCHTGAYKGKQSNIPGVNICMNCHSQVKEGPKYGKDAIAKLVKHYEEGKPIQWVRVHNLPDLAYFNHSQHTVAGGIECTKCHGQIDTMEVVHQHAPLTMGWCINCHRETAVNGNDNAYYDRLLKYHDDKVKAGNRKGDMTVENIGGTECSKCHY